MGWRRVEGPSLSGVLNTNYFVVSDTCPRRHCQLYLERVPLDNPEQLVKAQEEFDFYGFTTSGGTFRRRSVTEQTEFSRRAESLGLRVISPVEQVGDITYTRFLEGAQTLEEYLYTANRRNSSKMIRRVFSDLRRAHSLGIIYGDRWTQNVLVTPPRLFRRRGFTNIDFDIEISGNSAVELEVAQTAYYILLAGKDNVIAPLARILGRNTWFDIDLVKTFIQKQALFFDGTQWGGINKEIDQLIDRIDGLEARSNNKPLN